MLAPDRVKIALRRLSSGECSPAKTSATLPESVDLDYAQLESADSSPVNGRRTSSAELSAAWTHWRDASVDQRRRIAAGGSLIGDSRRLVEIVSSAERLSRLLGATDLCDTLCSFFISA